MVSHLLQYKPRQDTKMISVDKKNYRLMDVLIIVQGKI